MMIREMYLRHLQHLLRETRTHVVESFPDFDRRHNQCEIQWMDSAIQQEITVGYCPRHDAAVVFDRREEIAV